MGQIFCRAIGMIWYCIRAYIQANKHAICGLIFFVFGVSLYANTSYFVNRDALRFYPPFVAGVQHTQNTHLGGQYYAIAEALAAGNTALAIRFEQ